MKKTIVIEEKTLHIFSHDVKSLITSIYAYNQLVQKRLTKTGDDHTLKLTLRMQEQIQKLTQMIETFINK